jgi:hypothetical protein
MAAHEVGAAFPIATMSIGLNIQDWEDMLIKLNITYKDRKTITRKGSHAFKLLEHG